MLHSLFEIKAIPQITNIQFWRRFGGTETSERGADSADVHFRVIRDSHRRVMVRDDAQHRRRRFVGARR